MSNTFNGFPRGFIDFLFELHYNNTVANQSENLVKYKTFITEPLVSLYETLIPTVTAIDKDLQTKKSRCISKPYTDRRFSPDTPLKEYMYIRFKRADRNDNVPGLYFDMGIDYYSYGLRIYDQTSVGMDILRGRISGKPDIYASALDKVLSCGYIIYGDCFKKDRFPDMKDSSVKTLANRKRFYIGKNVPVNENVFTPLLTEEIADGFLKIKDIYNLISEAYI